CAAALVAVKASRAPAFEMILIEQLTHRERRAFTAVAHDRRDGVARAIYLDRDPLPRVLASLALRSLRSSFAVKSLVAALADRPRLPSRSRAWPWVILASREPAIIPRDDIKRMIGFLFVVGAAHVQAAAHFPRCGNKRPRIAAGSLCGVL